MQGGFNMTNLKEKAKKLPASPGVYLMKDSQGHIIYVGKSKNLKSRVQSYLQNSRNHSKKVIKLVNHLKDFEIIQTDTEFEAFLLECQLIIEIKPLYNKLMKSPQAYTYIRIQMNKGTNLLEMVSHIDEMDGSLYFGPFSSKNTVERAIKGLKEFFKIECSNPTNSHTPCLNYSLGLCLGMCFDYSAVKQYQQIIERVMALFSGTDISILAEMEQKMIEASHDFDFEKAAKLRDYNEAIKSLLKKEKVIEFTKENKNIVVLEFVDSNKLKMFLINRNKVLYKQLHKIDVISIEQLGQSIKMNILSYFNSSDHPSNMAINKDEIDEAQIIYRYLKSNACHYLIIPENWLATENHSNIDRAINELVGCIF